MKRLEVYLSGTVQGVGFRWFARQWGERLGLHGYARNLPDGRVEVVAEGPESLLQEFLLQLRQGPRSARVDDARVTWSDGRGDLHPFGIHA